jgi:hypothetical protein
VLRGLALDVVPIAGLLAESARTLREEEFATFRALASLDRPARERLLLSAHRFVRPGGPGVPSVAARRALMERFGVFGVRWGTALVLAGASSSSVLSARMIAQSGLQELERGMADQFRARATALKARWVVQGVAALLRDRPRPGAEGIRRELERVGVDDHDLRELQLLARLRTQGAPLAPERQREAARIIGGDGVSAAVRLDLPEGATEERVRDRAAELAGRWRGDAEFPLASQDAGLLCRLVARSAERALVSPG